jgi:type I restriction enzyme M protein
VQINEIAKASDWGDAKRIEEIRSKLRVFNRKEFQDLLFKCHSILRDVHKMDPGRAFDTISKILFVKMYVERSGLHGTFTVDFLVPGYGYETARCARHAAILNPLAASVSSAFCSALM